MKISMPKQAAFIINTLYEHGYEAYVVGGCVRDAVLGRKPSDWDITTSAAPEQVKALFEKTIDTGLKHGTVTIMIDKVGYEVTTYRIDGVYEDHRRPNEVTFTSSLKEDLMRRDLTINAMAYNDREGLIDLFGGAQDIERRVIRCVGNPLERFDEDALRMLRAVRFAGQLDFTIEEKTFEAIIARHKFLQDVSAERIRTELVKLLVSDHPEKLRDAYRAGLTGIFLPEFDRMMETPQNNPHHKYSVGEHTIHAVQAIGPDPVLRLAMLFHDIGKPETKTTDAAGIDHFYGHNKVSAEMSQRILRRLKFDNRTIRTVTTLVAYHDYLGGTNPKGKGKKLVRKTIQSVGEALFPYLLDVMEADILAQSEYQQSEKLRVVKEVREAYGEIIAASDCLTLKELAIGGDHLLALGIPEGVVIGDILDTLLARVLENPELNEYRYLEEEALKIYRGR